MRTKRCLVGLIAVFLTIFLTFQGNVFAQDAPDKTPQASQSAVKQDTRLQLVQILRIINFLSQNGDDPEFVSKLHDFFSVLYEAQAHFVDEKTMGELLDLAAKGMVSGLDSYSHLFIGKKEAQNMLKAFSEPSYPSGVGFSIEHFGKYIYVAEVFDGYSAARAGIEAGDIIRSVDGKILYGKSTGEVAQLIKGGEEGTNVSIEIDSNKRFQVPKTFVLTRERIKIASVTYRDLGDDIGYIKLKGFNDDPLETRREFINALKFLSGRKTIIDLRNNPGGSLATVGDLVSNFIGPGKTVIIQKDRDRDSLVPFMTGQPKLPDLPKKIVVLVNNFSASASEIMAGNLQYYGVATIIGVKTFGKATAQFYYDLDKDENDHNPDENTRLLMGITIAKYLLPDGRDIATAGVIPDIEVEQSDDFRSYEYGTERDLQLQAAIKFLNEN